MKYNYQGVGMNGIKVFIAAVIVAFLSLVGCSDSDLVTAYVLLKVEPSNHNDSEWIIIKPTNYRIGDTYVISETAGSIYRYEDCAIMSADNWECQNSNKSGNFGFNNGKYWSHPGYESFKSVSRIKYNTVYCGWLLDGKGWNYFWGPINCVGGWLTN